MPYENQDPQITDVGIACALGTGKKEVFQRLIEENSFDSIPHEIRTLISGRKALVRPVKVEVPSLGDRYRDVSNRTNGLLKICLDEISESVGRVRNKFGGHRISVVLGTNTAGMQEGTKAFSQRLKDGKWPSGFNYSNQEISSISEFAARYCGVSGPAFTVSTACTAGAKTFHVAKSLIGAGVCDAAIVGGVDTLCDLTVNGFDALELLSEKVCVPFSQNRCGINLGEGGAVFLLERGTQKENHIFLTGLGESSDAYHISSPDPEGKGLEKSTRQALKMAGLHPEDIHYLNLHGTGTISNDAMESSCFSRVFGEQVPCSSTKPFTGHVLGASGALEVGFLWLSLSMMTEGRCLVLPHIWDACKDPKLFPLNFVERNPFILNPKRGAYNLMSSSSAFGGSNASIILSKWIGER